MKSRTNQVTVDGIWVGSKSPYETRQPGGNNSISNPNQIVCSQYVQLANEIPFLQQSNMQNALSSEINALSAPPGPPVIFGNALQGLSLPAQGTAPASLRAPPAPVTQPSASISPSAPPQQPPPPTPPTTTAASEAPKAGPSMNSSVGFDLDAE